MMDLLWDLVEEKKKKYDRKARERSHGVNEEKKKKRPCFLGYWTSSRHS